MEIIKAFLAKFTSPRLSALVDKSAWLLIAPALLVLFMLDHAAAVTLVQWSLFALVLAGVGIIVSRLTFPQVHLGDLVDQAQNQGNVAAGLIAASIVIFVAVTLLAMVLWAKA